ncbi:MAG: pyridoxamine 5'-phosphate oxidase [Pseudonocardiales bacterium]|nr:MAG: pyridoxamine 5'-phosphate oxidase [Pseudonocardiales bacterium]
MTSWTDFAAAHPELAGRVRECFAIRKHATLATLRRDGSPRISGIEVEFTDDGIILGMRPDSLKALDLRRDPRLALHCPTEDTPPADPSSWLGDAKISGRAVELPSVDAAHRFALDLLEVVHTTVGTPADHLVIVSWHPDRGLQRRERR